MNKQFQELVVGERFVIDGQEYVKIAEYRISCCKTANARATNNANNVVYIQPNIAVTVNA